MGQVKKPRLLHPGPLKMVAIRRVGREMRDALVTTGPDMSLGGQRKEITKASCRDVDLG